MKVLLELESPKEFFPSAWSVLKGFGFGLLKGVVTRACALSVAAVANVTAGDGADATACA